MINTNYRVFISKISSSEHRFARKIRTVVTLSLFIALFSLMAACHDNNNSSSGRTGGLSEQDFANNPILTAQPGDGVILYLLESANALESANKTGEVGFDILPIKTEFGTNHTFCWDDIAEDSEHFMALLDIEGVELLKENVNGGCQTIFLEPGEYEIRMFNDDNTDHIIPIFIQYDRDEELFSQNISESGLLDKLLRALSFLDGSIDSHAQTEQEDNFTIFIDTWECPGCDLSGVDFSSVNYTGDPFLINLVGADLTDATMIGTVMWNATITDVSAEGAVLSYCNFAESFFSSSDFSNATISNVTFFGVALRGVKFTNSAMQSNDFGFADLGPEDDSQITDFDNAILDGSSFVDAFNVKDASFTGASMISVDLSNQDLTTPGLFTGATLDSANLSGVNLSDVAMLEVSFQNTNFTNADLSNFICIDCDFTGADFTGANTDGASLGSTE